MKREGRPLYCSTEIFCHFCSGLFLLLWSLFQDHGKMSVHNVFYCSLATSHLPIANILDNTRNVVFSYGKSNWLIVGMLPSCVLYIIHLFFFSEVSHSR